MKEPSEIFFAKYVIDKSLNRYTQHISADSVFYLFSSSELIDKACSFLEYGADGPNLRILAGSLPVVLDNDSGLVKYLVSHIDEEVKSLLPTLEAASKCCLIYYFKAYLAGNIDENSVMTLVFEVGQNISGLEIIASFLPLKYILLYYEMLKDEEFVYELSHGRQDPLYYIFYYMVPTESGYETLKQYENALNNYDTFEKLQMAIKTEIKSSLQKLSAI